ncbi:MAG: hypothetical protein KatS3mg033_1848 [Thermonema sp.]|nr:MAG: hypothetical protein KatS3mg033_1848 [Thermonema sp.]
MDLLPSLKAAISRIDEPMVRRWVEDLVINKTFAGLSTQQVILIRLSEHYCPSYKLASPEEEAKGIDGFIGTIPVSIKPQSYQSKALNEAIDVTIVFYKKKKNGIELQFDESAFLKL